MTKVFYFEGRIFETEQAVQAYAKNYNNQNYDVIETNKSYDDFEDAFDNAKSEGCSDLDAIEWAK